MRRWITLALAVFALVGCGGPTETVAEAPAATETPAATPTPTCQVLAQGYDDSMRDVLARWEDAKKIIASTPRMSLATPLADLQAIKREVEGMTPAICEIGVHNSLVAAMDITVNAYLSFLRNEGDDIVSLQLQQADILMTAYKSNINKLVRGEPIPGGDPPAVTPTP